MQMTEKRRILWATGRQKYFLDCQSLLLPIYGRLDVRSPFYVDQFVSDNDRDDGHLQCIIEVIGSIPCNYLQQWKGRKRFFDDQGNILPEQARDRYGIPLAERIAELKPADMTDHDAAVFQDLMRCIFRFEPKERLSASQILAHPWLRESS
ncbi:hypothetical protein MRB53_038287 [Persea americana]|nr:hypothetical protein MRB53_038287 [Persea americana]